jgi:hypothetical protein
MSIYILCIGFSISSNVAFIEEKAFLTLLVGLEIENDLIELIRCKQ